MSVLAVVGALAMLLLTREPEPADEVRSALVSTDRGDSRT
jgi:hypothetical protein